MLFEVIVIFKLVDDSLSTKWKPGLIIWLLNYSVNYVKAIIISFSLLLFIYIVRMELQPYTYIYKDVFVSPDRSGGETST